MLRFSANLGFLWPGLPLLERIDRAAKAGFRAIELHWPYNTRGETVRKACEKHRLTLLGINTVVGDAARGETGLGALAGREADFQAAIDQSLAYCRDSGANAVHAMAGVVPKDRRGNARAVFLRNLAEAAEKASGQGVMLLLEPLNPRDNPGYFYSTAAEAVSIIEELGSDIVRLMFDVYHVGVTEGDVIMKLRRYKDFIGHVQIAAVPSRAEPDEGEISYPAIFEELERIGYAGFIGCEYKPRAATEEGLNWVNRLGVRL
jgi:hydroxypyruvate isomerase